MIALPYPPSANVYWRMVQPKKGRARMVVSAEARAYKATVRTALLKAGVRPLDGAVTLTVHLYRPQKSGDLDNRLKVLGDSLNGLAWHDDEQVVEIHAYRLDDKARPRVEVEVDYAAPPRFFAPAPVPKEFLRAAHTVPTPKMPSGKWNKTKVAAFNQDTPPIAYPPLGFATSRLPRPAYTPPRSTPMDAAREAEATFAPEYVPPVEPVDLRALSPIRVVSRAEAEAMFPPSDEPCWHNGNGELPGPCRQNTAMCQWSCT